MNCGVKFLELKSVAYLSSGLFFVFRRRIVGFVGWEVILVVGEWRGLVIFIYPAISTYRDIRL